MSFWSRLRGIEGRLLVALAAIPALLFSSGLLLQPDRADAARDERTVSLYEIHLKETTTITFKRDGKYIPAGLKKFNYAMRDWRTGAVTRMDRRLLDLIWQLHNDVGANGPVHVISGHRSAKTNRRLRKRGGGQARKSQHVRGRAMDIHFPGVAMSDVRKYAFKHEQGGVGYYPTSALPFVHVDTARVRSWPRMSRTQLAMLFPHGRTKHRPSSGGPLTSRDRKRARVRLAMLARKNKTSTLLASVRIPANNAALAGRSTSGGSSALSNNKIQPIIVASLANRNTLDVPRGSRHAAALWINKPGNLALPETSLRPKRPAPSPLVQQLLASAKNTPRSPARTPSQRPKARIQLASLSPDDVIGVRTQQKSNLWVDGAGLRASWLTENSVAIRRPKAVISAPNISPKTAQPIAKKQRIAALTTATFQKTRHTKSHQFDAERVAYAPSFDEEHPDELSYRPFQILPLMAVKPIAQNTTLVAMVEPKYDLIHELLLSSENIPMQFRPSPREAEMLWNNQFKGNAILNIRKQALNTLLPTRPQRLAQR